MSIYVRCVNFNENTFLWRKATRRRILFASYSLSLVYVARRSWFDFRFSFFDIWTESENRILTFKILKILFWHSLWVRKFYFDIQNSILTFTLSRKVLFWHSLWVGKSYFDIQISTLAFALSPKSLFWHSKSYCCESENPLLTFKVLFWHFPIYDYPTQFCIRKRIGFPGCIFGKAR